MLRGIFTLMILLSCSAMATAAQVTYSWTGILSPIEGSLDPWNVGPTDQPYTIAVTVDGSAPDNSASVGLAHFDILALEFSIAGVPVTNIDFSGSSLDFDDVFFLGTSDYIGITFLAELNGHTENFGSSVLLPADTFSFLQSGEQPPVFGSTNTSLVFGHFLLQYFSNTAVGTSVTSTVVPEPSTYGLAAAALAALVWVRRRRV